MGKKIKINENQYSILFKLLLEELSSDSLRYIEDGDIIHFDTKNDTIFLEVKNVDETNGNIDCVNVDDGTKVILNKNSYNSINQTLNLKVFDPNKNIYNGITVKINDLGFRRDKQPFIPPNITQNTNNSSTSYLPKEFNNLDVDDILVIKDEDDVVKSLKFIKKLNGDFYFKNESGYQIKITKNAWDEFDSELVYNILNPNTNDFISKKIKVKSFSVSKINDTIDTPEEQDDMFRKFYRDIINDPDIKSAFYKAPSLWNYFTSAIKNKKARGTGILPAYELISKYYDKKIDDKLPGFSDKQNKKAEFYFLDQVGIEYYSENRKNTEPSKIVLNGTHRATVRPYKGGDGNTKTLTNSDEGFKIKVKKPITNEDNVYLCDVSVYKKNIPENKFEQENVRIKFYESEGYVPVKK